jgi:hypothetical protein
VRAHDDALLARAAEALRAVEDAAQAAGAPDARAHVRGRLLSAVAFSMALAGCGQRPLPLRDGAATYGTSSMGTGGAPGTGGVPGIGGTVGGTGGATDAGQPLCPDGVRVQRNLSPATTCLDDCSRNPLATVQFDQSGYATDVVPADGAMVSAPLLQCIRDTLAKYCYPSVAGTTQTLTGHCWIA